MPLPSTLPSPSVHTLLDFCLDDAQGLRLSVLWEFELGAKVLQPEAEGLGAVAKATTLPGFDNEDDP